MSSERKIQQICSEQDHAEALARIEALMDMDRTPAEDDEINGLATLVEAYEDLHFPMDPPDPVEEIKFHMDQSGMSERKFATIFGSRMKFSKVMKRERNLDLRMIYTLHKWRSNSTNALIRLFYSRIFQGRGKHSTYRFFASNRFALKKFKHKRPATLKMMGKTGL